MAKISDKTLNVILAIVLTFLIVGNLAGTVILASQNISGLTNASGTPTALPLAGLFGTTGIVLLIFMIGVLRRIMKAAK